MTANDYPTEAIRFKLYDPRPDRARWMYLIPSTITALVGMGQTPSGSGIVEVHTATAKWAVMGDLEYIAGTIWPTEK